VRPPAPSLHSAVGPSQPRGVKAPAGRTREGGCAWFRFPDVLVL